MSLTYPTYVAQFSNLLVVASSDGNFQTFLPGAIDYAEQRMYRELDLLVTRVSDNSGSLTANNKFFTLPTGQGNFLVVEEVNIVTPSSVTFTSSIASINPCECVSRPFIDQLYPNVSSAVGVPRFFSMNSNTQITVGPAPDLPYNVQIVGTQFPTPLSSGNPNTFLTQYLPEAFMAASMVFGSAYQRDFGSMGDDPSKAQSWESQYKQLMASAQVLEFRKMYRADAWTSENPSPVAKPPRV